MTGRRAEGLLGAENVEVDGPGHAGDCRQSTRKSPSTEAKDECQLTPPFSLVCSGRRDYSMSKERESCSSVLENARRRVLGAPARIAVLVTVLVLASLGALGVFFGGIPIPRYFGSTTDYLLGVLVKDVVELGLKLGALVGGILAVYRYWYNRYEPLVYFVSCGLVDQNMAAALMKGSPKLRALCGGIDVKDLKHHSCQEFRDAYCQCQDLPLVIMHKNQMASLCLKEADRVDVEFDLPDGGKLWAIAYAFNYDTISTHIEIDGYDHLSRWPLGITMSLRRYFRMERPVMRTSSGPLKGSDPEAPASLERRRLVGDAPKGWQIIRVNAKFLVPFHRVIDGALYWMVRDDYTVRFFDRSAPDDFYSEDSVERAPQDDSAGPTAEAVYEPGRVAEYTGISLRVHRRNWIRYRPSA
jgi:hypothetical protein